MYMREGRRGGRRGREGEERGRGGEGERERGREGKGSVLSDARLGEPAKCL